MKLKAKEIRSFISLSNAISTNNIIPILAYIKLENGSLCKTNLRTYIVHKIDAPAEETLLLDEKVLVAFLKECKSEEIEIKKDVGRTVYLIDGKRKMKYQSAPVKDFPQLPDAEKEDAVELDADTLSAIGVAAKNVTSTGLSHQLDFVHLVNGSVVASDNTALYCRKVGNIPDLVLDVECANTISKFQDATYYSRGRYNFFEIGSTLYGFIRSEVKTPDFSRFIPSKQGEQYIDIAVDDIVGFCDTVIAASSTKGVDGRLFGNKLSFNEPETDFEYSIDLEVEGDYQPDITFNPKTFGGYFKSLGISKVRLCKSELNNPSLSVWDLYDDAFSGIVIGTMPVK